MKGFILAAGFSLAAFLLGACKPGGTEANKPAAPVASSTPAPAPDAITADPAHYKVLFENDAARLIRISYPPGAKSVMHNHPAGCGIFIVDQRFKFTSQPGEDQNVE